MKTFIISHSKIIIKILVGAVWLILWQCAYNAVGVDLLMVSPLTVLRRLSVLVLEGSFWLIIAGSMGRILLGFFLGLVTGVVIAVLTSRFYTMYEFFSLPLNIIKATPVASFVILALVWIRGTNLSVFIAFLMVLPLIWSNMHEGITKVDRNLLEMAQVYAVKKISILKNITIPSVLPYFMSALRVGLGFSWKAGIAGEVIAIPKNAIGTQLYNSKIYLETPDLFAWTTVIIILSVLIEKFMVFIIDRTTSRINRIPEVSK